MELSLYMLPGDIPEGALRQSDVAVIDALRMTSVAITAFENGCARLSAVRTVDEALAMRGQDGQILLGGERGGRLIPGFDLDNSPLHFTRAAVENRHVCMTTTNGTQAIVACSGARRVLLGAFLNASAVAKALAGAQEAAIVCAGTGDRLSMEDVVAGGAMIARLEEMGVALALDDGAIAARRLYREARGDLHAALSGTHHYGVMRRGGQQEDIDFCLREDVYSCVPCREEDGTFTARARAERAEKIT